MFSTGDFLEEYYKDNSGNASRETLDCVGGRDFDHHQILRVFFSRDYFSWEGGGTLPLNGYKPSGDVYEALL